MGGSSLDFGAEPILRQSHRRAAGSAEGALFRQVPKGWTYYDVIETGIAGIALDARKFGSHPMRSGWISTAARNGASVWTERDQPA